MSDPNVVATHLPENAYRELKPGETYTPMVPASVTVPEITGRSIAFGIIMNVIFSMAATYLALKVGQGIETAIPISILSVGLAGVLARAGFRKSSLLENVNVLAISTTSGIVAGGTVFTMPAIYLLKLNENLKLTDTQLFLQIFFVPFLGAVLGVVFLVPFRGYFVRLMHGKLPFPEATATNEILATGAGGGGGQAWVLIYSFLLAVVYNFISVAMKVFNAVFTTGETTLSVGKRTIETYAFPRLESFTKSVKAVFSLGTSAAFLGLGFIIGLRYATIICCGSFVSCFVLVPLFAGADLSQLQTLNPAIKGTSPEAIFSYIPRIIGIGGIFAAGLISIIKMSKIIFTALREAIGGLLRSRGDSAHPARTEHDMSYTTLLLLLLGTTLAMFLYFRFSVLATLADATRLSLIATLLALILSFLFTTVSAWAIAMISTTPLSGMTVTTIIITAAALLGAGLPKGDVGMMAVLLVGGVVCTALSMAATLVTEFKIGYWIGATPRKIQWSAILSALLASALVTATIMVLAYKPGYIKTDVNLDPLTAPQANLMKSTLESFVGSGGQVPWTLYATGAVLAVIVNYLGISPLAFMLGMYLPMHINTPILVGAIVAALVGRGNEKDPRTKARKDKGVLVASGLIAGAAIIDVLINALAIFDEQKLATSASPQGRVMPWLDMPRRWLETATSPEDLARYTNTLGLVAFLVLCLLVYLDCRRAKPGASTGPSLQH
ncbi:OPT oligopeptide transporter protein [Phycisphaerae bacterium RAS2]|nr:OPT oligopeptide transporter protein [Phycisphaerae bacterium RAS2]